MLQLYLENNDISTKYISTVFAASYCYEFVFRKHFLQHNYFCLMCIVVVIWLAGLKGLKIQIRYMFTLVCRQQGLSANDLLCIMSKEEL